MMSSKSCRWSSARLCATLIGCALLACAGGCTREPGVEERLERASAAIAGGELRQAALDLRRALQEDPANLAARLQLVAVLVRAGEIPLARRGIDEARTLAPTNPEVLELDYRVALAEGRADYVVEHSETRHRDAPEGLRVLRARALLERGRLDEAERELRSIAPDAPHGSEARVALAEAAWQRGRPDEAVGLLEQVLARTDASQRAYQRAAEYRLARRDPAGAERILDAALKRFSPDEDPRQRAALIVLRTEARLHLRNTVAARASLEELLALAGEIPAALRLQTWLATLEGDGRKALEAAQRLVQRDPQNAQSLLLLADVKLAHGATEQALMYATRAAQIDPENPDATRLLATVRLRSAQQLLAQRDFAAARDLLEQVVGAEPANAVAFNNLAWACNELNDPRALEYARQALRLRPNDAAVRDTLGWILFTRGQATAALEELRAASAAAPANGDIAHHLAAVLIASGRKAEAREVLERALRSDSAFAARAEAERLLMSIS